MSNPTEEYVAGLVNCIGRFTFYTTYRKGVKLKTPAFLVSIPASNKYILEVIVATLDLKERIYTHKNIQSDHVSREKRCILIIRKYGSLRKIIDFSYKYLLPEKILEMESWLAEIDTGTNVVDRFKTLAQ
ncbi:MAG: hypothetical protein COU06_02825 [Candidatus Harrisonbacteria bacterium CG10_big_fil_rev_8_21_14_0_10_38_8]|uniref:Homing endonuclease LAGLIDADG domain-containing protein n=1 Tax=Candidatus Harrisonbacteria bacterium CG10_big_fil_rev_8_21_14_0_10_38_8 TaxID=1974582 RepID=A0A2M6WJD7_9BACT|nr:MAG: hypothetical protein COU06_02825 [Candidatus Harrisonbacteria bacterium CG10_big_fil_rev_8_21_14_0_10_38_8]